MIDGRAGDVAGDALRGFIAGRLSNRDYERRFTRSKTDGALRAIHVALWFMYSDVREQFVGRNLMLSEEQRTTVRALPAVPRQRP